MGRAQPSRAQPPLHDSATTATTTRLSPEPTLHVKADGGRLGVGHQPQVYCLPNPLLPSYPTHPSASAPCMSKQMVAAWELASSSCASSRPRTAVSSSTPAAPPAGPGRVQQPSSACTAGGIVGGCRPRTPTRHERPSAAHPRSRPPAGCRTGSAQEPHWLTFTPTPATQVDTIPQRTPAHCCMPY